MIAKNIKIPKKVIIPIQELFENNPARNIYKDVAEFVDANVFTICDILSGQLNTPIKSYENVELLSNGTAVVSGIVALPAKVEIRNASALIYSLGENIEDDEGISDDVCDILSDDYGFCINSFKYHYNKKADTITVTDIDWDIDE